MAQTFDMGQLTPEDTTEEVKTQRGRKGSRYESSPARPWVEDSYKRDVAKTFEVPNEHLERIVKEIRGAAQFLKVGVTIARLPSKKKDHTRVSFKAREKRVYNQD